MALWPVVSPVVPPVLAPWFSWPYDRSALSTSINASTAWGTANRAIYWPIEIPEVCLITTLWWQNGASVAGNVDVAIYDDQGNRLVTAANPAQAGVSAIQSVDVADVELPPGLYYFGLSCSSAAATLWATAAGLAQEVGHSVYLQAAANPLPNPATFATVTGISIKLFKFGALVGPRTVL